MTVLIVLLAVVAFGVAFGVGYVTATALLRLWTRR